MDSAFRESALEPVAGEAKPTHKPFEQITLPYLREGRPVLRVLLADDNRVNQVLARRLLEQRGHFVVVANNGREVLARLKAAAKAEGLNLDIRRKGNTVVFWLSDEPPKRRPMLRV